MLDALRWMLSTASPSSAAERNFDPNEHACSPAQRRSAIGISTSHTQRQVAIMEACKFGRVCVWQNASSDLREMMSLSGAGLSVEDVHAYYQFFARREDGNIKTYVELGAVDGKSYSVSLFFQRLGWHGVLIEPYLPNYVLLAKAAARKYRVNVTILHAAACPRPRMLYFPLRASTDSNYDPFGHDRGVAMATSTESAARVLAKDAERGHKVKNPWSFTTMCLPMATLLQAAPQMKTARGIDFYSIDVEPCPRWLRRFSQRVPLLRLGTGCVAAVACMSRHMSIFVPVRLARVCSVCHSILCAPGSLLCGLPLPPL